MEYSYEKIYYTLWELSRRYSTFTQFRVIGKSHDERYIPSLEIGQGKDRIYCLSGMNGTEQKMPSFLTKMAELYCKAYECHWILEEYYDIYEIFAKWKILFLPLLNPDGYEIVRKGYLAVKNSVFRQLLEMKEITNDAHSGNVRGICLENNFPKYCAKEKKMQGPLMSENETKALVKLFREDSGQGLLSFYSTESKRSRVKFQKEKNPWKDYKSFQIKKNMEHILEEYEKKQLQIPRVQGNVEQFYTDFMKKPSFSIELSIRKEEIQKGSGEKYCIPLECLKGLLS